MLVRHYYFVVSAFSALGFDVLQLFDPFVLTNFYEWSVNRNCEYAIKMTGSLVFSISAICINCSKNITHVIK